MGNYMVTEEVFAKPMSNTDFNAEVLKGGLNSEIDGIPGYYVVRDVYDTKTPEWINKEDFEATFNKVSENLSFGQALELIKLGHLVARKKWGEGINIFIRPEYVAGIADLSRIKSLPKYFVDEELKNKNSVDVKFHAYICKKLGNSIINGWVPSQVDMLTNDWYVVK